MSISIELLDAFKAARGGLSDYAVSPELGVSQQFISLIRKDRANFSPEKILFICESSGLDAIEWLLRYHRERAKCTAEIKVWDTLLTRAAA